MQIILVKMLINVLMIQIIAVKYKVYDLYQYSLVSMVNLVPLPKKILFPPLPVFTQHEAS